MTTKVDHQFASGVVAGVNALVLEVQRLEGELEKIKRIIDPNPSAGGDTVWLVQNAFNNMNEEIARLNKKCSG